jgi:hypothetical protein
MANNIPFQVKGKTTRINLTTSANTVAILADNPSNQLRIHNGTAAEVFVHVSTSASNAAVIPVAGTPAYGFLLHNNGTVIITTPAQASNGNTCFVSGIVASGTATIYVTPGEGL